MSQEDYEEQLALMAGFEEAAAVSVWTLITMMELNEEFFVKSDEEYELAKSYLDGGLAQGEKGNHRAAFHFYIWYIDKILKTNPELVLSHPKLVDAVKHIRNIQKNVLNPLWEKHQHALVKT